MAVRPSLPAGFDAAFDTARASVFRLETLQAYGNSGEDPALDAFVDGQPYVLTPGKRSWTSLVRDRRRAGCAMERVHVVTEPLTEYALFELTWGYTPNVRAGEDIRIIPVGEGEHWPATLPRDTDFWLFDASTLYAMRYHQDGSWLGVDLVTDPYDIDQAVTWRDTALRLGIPWADYIRGRPHLERLVESIPRAS
ncbi:MAG: hypothetical protein M3R63_15330 [Actinomycetota bacterium]|nr:hypothetical protein [Actinomycetota bacterium]